MNSRMFKLKVFPSYMPMFIAGILRMFKLQVPGIVGIEYVPHYCQYGWTAVSVSLDLFSNR